MDWVMGWMAPPQNTSQPSHSSDGQVSLQQMHKNKWQEMQGPPRPAAFSGLFGSGPEDISRALERGDVANVALQRRNEMESEFANSDADNSGFPEPSAPSGAMAIHPGPGSQAVNISEHKTVVAAARRKKTRRGLQPWEADSDSENEYTKGTAAADEFQTADWNPFSTHSMADAAEDFGSRPKGYPAADLPWQKIGASLQPMPDELKSHEEDVLGIRPDTDRRREKAIVPTGAMTNGEIVAATDMDDEQGIRDAREAARRESHSLVELETWKMWPTSKHAQWIPGEEYGTLVGEHHKSSAHLDSWSVSDFDVEAEVMIEKGTYGGLLFRWNGRDMYAMCINLKKQQLEFQSPLGTEVLVFRAFAQERWYRLRVRAADDTLMFFLENQQIDQVVGYRQHDNVYYCDTNQNAIILNVNENGTYKIKLEDDSEKDDVATFGLKPLAGSVGVVANETRLRIRNVVLINLQDYVGSLRHLQQKMDEERQVLRVRDRDAKAALTRRSMAARLIQEIGKLKNGLLNQRMEVYKQAEQQGREEQLRERRLLTWMTLLNVLAKINQEMSQPTKQSQRDSKRLVELDDEAPPPPPPPMRSPPSKEEEELHYRYEAMKAKYAPQWNKAGNRMLGKEKFEKVKNMQAEKDTNAFAGRHKEIAAQRCLDEAINAMSEKEHADWLKKAWCFEHELAEGDDQNQKEEMEQWYLKKVEERKEQAQAPKGIGKNM